MPEEDRQSDQQPEGQQTAPDLEALLRLFYDDPRSFGRVERVEASALPDTPRTLLAHNAHMTVTVERFYGCPVRVEVLQTQSEQDRYSRKILLRRTTDDQVVQFGIVRLDFSYVGPQVREEIESQRTPLGRVLIQHNVLCEVQLRSLWKITPGDDLRRLLGLAEPAPIYGRTALIYCNGAPAVELLEVVV